MLDLLLRGGTVVDGTGRPGVTADVGVRDGRIVAVGEVDEAARVVRDVTGLVVAPGFVDIHTHYDAQLSWDPLGSPSGFHGVTTVVGGNCGFSIAPLRPSESDYLMRMLARVEGMPLAALQAGVGWDWEDFGSWLGRFDGELGINAGFLVGHSAIRRSVMGERSYEAATEADVEAMIQLAHESLAAGALGFSSSLSPTHNDGAGRPVPSRGATREELLRLAATVRDHPGTVLEFIPEGLARGMSATDGELLADISLAGERAVNWNMLTVSSEQPQDHEALLAMSSQATERGARVVALTLPDVMRVYLTLGNGFGFDGLPGWDTTMALPLDERAAALRDPAVLDRLRAGAAEAPPLFVAADFAAITVVDTHSEANEGLVGRRIGDIAAERGLDPLTALVEVSLADDLRTGLRPKTRADDEDSWIMRGAVWHDERTVLGASDAGAHVDMMCAAGYTTALLGRGVRQRGLLTLEEAVRQITDVPARLYGLVERGRVVEGWHADLVVFDPDLVDSGPEHSVRDLPGGAERLTCDAVGIAEVIVNGVEVIVDGTPTGARPGTALRSGTDTETVPLPAAP